MPPIDDNIPTIPELTPTVPGDNDLPVVGDVIPPQENERIVLALPDAESVQEDPTVNVVKLVGSNADEELRGNSANNKFIGRGGTDTLFGFDGNDNLNGGSGDDFLYGGNGVDRLTGGRGADFLDGGAGTKDYAQYHSSDAAVTINLETGVAEGGHAEGDTLVNIERINGSKFNDSLTGDIADNVLIGRNGDDILSGGLGNDMLNGGNGADTLIGGDGKDNLLGGAGADVLDGGAGDNDRANYRNSKEGINIDLVAGTGSGGNAEGDVLIDIEQIYATKFDDILTGDDGNNRFIGRDGEDVLDGGAGNDVLYGGNDNDVLIGGAGRDKLNGGKGDRDTADYRESDAGVQVDLTTGRGTGGDAQGDRLSSIEDTRGSAFEDALTGDDVVNRLMGNEGDDELFGMGGNDMLLGGEGADLIDGDDGIDTTNYQHADEGVGVNLATGGFAGEATGDTFVDVEFFYGSKFDDTAIGDDLANRLNGQAGDDILDGAGGRDTLIGDLGNDTLTGGDDLDLFLFRGNFGNDVITDFEAGAGIVDRIYFQSMGLSMGELSLTDATDGLLIEAGTYGTLLLEGVVAADLAADDFIF